MYAYIPEATSLLFINLFSEKSTCLSLLIEIFYSIMLCQSILNFNINMYNEHLYNRTSCTKYSSKKNTLLDNFNHKYFVNLSHLKILLPFLQNNFFTGKQS